MNDQYQVGLLAPLSPVVYVRRRTRVLPWPLEEPDASLFARARQGLWAGVRALGLKPGDAVLAPAYHHGSEIEALLRAGLSVRFYDLAPSLRPDPERLGELVDSSVRALHLTHWLGVPQDAPAWRKWCDERGLYLIEDAAQAWQGSIDGRPLGTWGDVSIFCLYKTVGVPDGGVLFSRGHRVRPASRKPLGLRLLVERHAAWAMSRLPSSAPWGRGPYDPSDYDPLEDFDLHDPGTPISWASSMLLRKVVRGDEAERRRRNYRKLLEALHDHVPEELRVLANGASPFAFPIEAQDKLALLAHLHVAGIDCLNLWSVPHPSLEIDRHPVAARLRRHVIGLPVHHELTGRDIERIAREVGRGITS